MNQSKNEQHTVANLGTVDLNDVAAFVKVVASESFTQAARQLGVPKSAVSRRVSRLEEALGARLLQRTTRRLNLTDAGARYYRQANEALAALYDAKEAVEQLQAEPRGTVRITAPGDFHEFLAEPLRVFAARYPKIYVEAVLTGRRVDLVGEGFDLALRAGYLLDSSLRVRRLGDTPLVTMAAPAYLDRCGTPQRPEELADHTCILFRSEDGQSRWQLSGPDGERAVTVRGPVGSDDFALVRALAKLGAGIALVPLHSCVAELNAKELVRVLPTWSGPTGALFLVYPSSRQVPQRVVLLREHLYESLRNTFEQSVSS
jgi:DNA-binding transcriptional LysR family regulator